MYSTKKRLLSNVFDVRFSAVWRLLPAGMLLVGQVNAQSPSELGSNRDASGVVFPNADWIRFPARPSKSAPAVVTAPEPAPAAPNGNNDWIQFPRLPV